jgi:hypothetical protein
MSCAVSDFGEQKKTWGSEWLLAEFLLKRKVKLWVRFDWYVWNWRGGRAERGRCGKRL